MFPVVVYQFFTDPYGDFGPLFFADPLQILKACRLSLGNSNLQLALHILRRIKVWRLTKPFHYLNGICVMQMSHSSVALAECFGSLLCWNTYPWPIFIVLAEVRKFSLKISLYFAPSIFPLTWCSHPIPLAEKQPQSIMISPPYLIVDIVFSWSKSAFFFTSKISVLRSSQKAQF